MLRAWHSAVVVAGVVVPVAVDAEREMIGAVTENGDEKTQLEFHP